MQPHLPSMLVRMPFLADGHRFSCTHRNFWAVAPEYAVSGSLICNASLLKAVHSILCTGALPSRCRRRAINLFSDVKLWSLARPELAYASGSAPFEQNTRLNRLQASVLCVDAWAWTALPAVVFRFADIRLQLSSCSTLLHEAGSPRRRVRY